MTAQVQVVTVYAPRPNHDHWRDYLPLLRAQRDSAHRVGHDHLVVTDTDLGSEFDQMHTELSQELMPAMIEGVIARLIAPCNSHLALVDIDCLIAQNLLPIYSDRFDLGLTHRLNEAAPINNGAMYVNRWGVPLALPIFENALSMCKLHWGGDQEAISKAVAPVPAFDCIKLRGDCRVAFLNMKRFAAVPKHYLSQHGVESYIIHFKGETKDWMLPYAAAYLKK